MAKKVVSLGLGLLSLLSSAKANSVFMSFDFEKGVTGYSRFVNHLRNNPRWSIVAGKRISPYLHHSPYAFGVDHNGIVPNTTRYSTYAFGVRHSGLVDNVNLSDASKNDYLISWPQTRYSIVENQQQTREESLENIQENYENRLLINQLKKDRKNQRKKAVGTITKNYLSSLGLKVNGRSSFNYQGKNISASYYLPETNQYLIVINPKLFSQLDLSRLISFDRQQKRINENINALDNPEVILIQDSSPIGLREKLKEKF